jgi:OmcA/MtrC family decaheme c-type cytochrome
VPRGAGWTDGPPNTIAAGPASGGAAALPQAVPSQDASRASRRSRVLAVVLSGTQGDDMTTRGRNAAIAVATVAAMGLFVGACGDDDDDDGGNGGPAPTAESVVAPYGFKIEIQSAEIPADPTTAATPPTVTFRVTGENDAPIDDLQQRIKNFTATPRAYPHIRAPSFTLARLEPDTEYRAYYLNADNQATNGGGVPGEDAEWADRVTALGNGTYRFELNPLGANPTAEERARTHTVGVYGSNVPAEGLDEQAASATLNFVPAGGNPELHQVVALQGCNTCHGPAVQAHGRRLGVQLCLTCHTSQTADEDPPNNSVEFTEMIHKIHYGSGRPGETYEITGFNETRFVFDAPFINDVRNCTLCHQGEDADRHLTAPTEQSCTTCHSIVRFDSSGAAGCNPELKDTAACNHFPIAAGTDCATCHTPDVLRGQHVPMTQVAQQFGYEIQSVTVDAGRIPTARVRVLDTATNQARDLETDPTYTDSGSSLNVKFGWPSKEYTNVGASTTAPGQPVSVSVVGGGALQTENVTKVAGQTGVYDVTSPIAIPATVTSATAFMDGHPRVRGENVPVVNVTSDFGVGGAAEARRQVVAVENCNACHGVVSAHGQNRNGNISACVVCHNPKATDWQRRQGISDPTDAATEQSVDFKVLIHAVHSADIRRDDFVVYGFGSSRNTFPGEIPHGVGNCNLCHVNQSWALPLAPEVLDPVVNTNNTAGNQADDTTAGRVRSVCTACHDQVQFAQQTPALPMCNTLPTVNSAPCIHSGGAQTDDSTCAACHGPSAPFDIATRHPIQ